MIVSASQSPSVTIANQGWSWLDTDSVFQVSPSVMGAIVLLYFSFYCVNNEAEFRRLFVRQGRLINKEADGQWTGSDVFSSSD